MNDNPTMSLVVKNPLFPRERDDLTFEVSNTDAIDLEVDVRSDDQRVVSDVSTNRKVSVEVHELVGLARRQVNVRLVRESYVIHAGNPKVFLSIFIPLDPHTHRKRIEDYIDETLQAGIDGNQAGAHFAQGIMMNKSTFIEQLEDIFIENAPGTYEIVAIYENQYHSGEEGIVRSTPLAIRVVPTGSAFDARNAPPSRL